MVPDSNLVERGVLIITGSRLRAEQADRPLAYRLQDAISQRGDGENRFVKNDNVLVISDLWYLNSEPLQKIPAISLGGPGINAASANFFDKLEHVLVVDHQFQIQMELNGQGQRACVWGQTHELTVNALDVFIENGFLDRFLVSVNDRLKHYK